MFGRQFQIQMIDQFRITIQSKENKQVIRDILLQLRDFCVSVKNRTSEIEVEVNEGKEVQTIILKQLWQDFFEFSMQILGLCVDGEQGATEVVRNLECLACLQFTKRATGVSPLYQKVLTKSIERVYRDQDSCIAMINTLDSYEKLVSDDAPLWQSDNATAAKLTFLFKIIQGTIPKCCQNNEDVLKKGLFPQLYLYLHYPSQVTNSVVLQLFRVLFQETKEKLAIRMVPFFIKRSLQVCGKDWFDWDEFNRCIIVATSRCWNDMGIALFILHKIANAALSQQDIELVFKIGSCLCGALLVIPVELIRDCFEYYEQIIKFKAGIKERLIGRLFEILNQCHDQSRKFECAQRYKILQQKVDTTNSMQFTKSLQT
eukprot:TRINITY_DN12437_c0_g1_i4.p1 TRINITY_DN12437_c0_g1~~TRINITY_DN12437_c0_g1_i4.p1  ORF type:complete len:373 (-),score=30.18 TRINITY_DN12437_c0_g1_i4:51-1169(-)